MGALDLINASMHSIPRWTKSFQFVDFHTMVVLALIAVCFTLFPFLLVFAWAPEDEDKCGLGKRCLACIALEVVLCAVAYGSFSHSISYFLVILVILRGLLVLLLGVSMCAYECTMCVLEQT